MESVEVINKRDHTPDVANLDVELKQTKEIVLVSENVSEAGPKRQSVFSVMRISLPFGSFLHSGSSNEGEESRNQKEEIQIVDLLCRSDEESWKDQSKGIAQVVRVIGDSIDNWDLVIREPSHCQNYSLLNRSPSSIRNQRSSFYVLEWAEFRFEPAHRGSDQSPS